MAELANIVREMVGYKSKIVYDTPKSEETAPQIARHLAVAALGWTPRTSLRDEPAAADSHFLSSNAVRAA